MKRRLEFSRRAFLQVAGLGGVITLAAAGRLLRRIPPALDHALSGVAWQRSARSGSWAPLDALATRRWLAANLNGRPPGEVAFLLGPAASESQQRCALLAQALGNGPLVQFDLWAEFEGRPVLSDAVQRTFGARTAPVFDLAAAETVLFLAPHFGESWLAQATPSPGARWVVLGPYRPARLAAQVEWLPLAPDRILPLLLALVQAVANLRQADLPEATFTGRADRARTVGISERQVQWLAGWLVESPSALVVPGGLALADEAGGSVARAALGLNVLLNNLGKPGGLFLSADFLDAEASASGSNTLAEVEALLERIHHGLVKTLVVYDLDLLRDLPAGLQVATALSRLERLVVLSDEMHATAQLAHLALPLAGLAELEIACSLPTGQPLLASGSLPERLPPVLVAELPGLFTAATLARPPAAGLPRLVVLPQAGIAADWVHLSPTWARQLRLRPGQALRLRSAHGQVQARVQFSGEVAPGALGVAPALTLRLLGKRYTTAGSLALSNQPFDLMD